jgi:hypothetical protein
MTMTSKLKILLFCSIIIFSISCCPGFQSSGGFTHKEVAELEEYLIDFSKKIEGHRLLTGSLPSDLNAEKFFSILEKYYPDKEIIQKVNPVRNSSRALNPAEIILKSNPAVEQRGIISNGVNKYPVRVFPENHSYVLILCDKESKFILYKDLSKTITLVDYPYWRDGKRVPCRE